MFTCTYASSQVKRKSFYRKKKSRCFCLFPAAILVHQNGTPIWRLHTKIYKGAWNVSANNSKTVDHTDLRLGKLVCVLVFYNISFSWLLPIYLFVAWQWKRSMSLLEVNKMFVQFHCLLLYRNDLHWKTTLYRKDRLVLEVLYLLLFTSEARLMKVLSLICKRNMAPLDL